MANLEVDLVAADRSVWTGEARMVSAPAADGEIGVLPGHSPVLTVLRPGTVRITPVDGGSQHVVRIDAGFMSVDSNHVTVVVDTAEDAAPGSAGRPTGSSTER